MGKGGKGMNIKEMNLEKERWNKLINQYGKAEGKKGKKTKIMWEGTKEDLTK